VTTTNPVTNVTAIQPAAEIVAELVSGAERLLQEVAERRD
jgi:hypothetical protein